MKCLFYIIIIKCKDIKLLIRNICRHFSQAEDHLMLYNLIVGLHKSYEHPDITYSMLSFVYLIYA